MIYKTRPLPGRGVLDPTDKVGYFPAVKGGIEALDLATGKVLWSYEGGSLPLLATDKLIFVQKGKAILILDTAGKLVRETEAIKMPEWVSIEKIHGRSYSSSCYAEGKQFWYSYQANSFYPGGARPTP